MYKLSPSSLTFEWDSCKYCFYLRVKHGIYVSGIFPGIFGKMANLTSQFYLGKPSSALVGTAPAMVAGGPSPWQRTRPPAAGRGEDARGVRQVDADSGRSRHRASSERSPILRHERSSATSAAASTR